jgi:hypothetical protein
MPINYGTACEVLEPPELVELFRHTAEGLIALHRQRDQAKR